MSGIEEEWDYDVSDEETARDEDVSATDEFAGMALGEVTLAYARNRLFARDGAGGGDPRSLGEEEPESASDDACVAVAQGVDSLKQEERVFDSENVGLGVDIVDIDRMRKILARSKSFSRLVFSADEQEYCEKTSSPETHYALRFAAKEAVVKALGTGFSEGIGVLDIEVRRNAKGRPYVALRGVAKDVAAKKGVRDIPISLSYTHTEAVACAMAITESSRKASEQRVDPMEELTRKFKETRSMLDDL